MTPTHSPKYNLSSYAISKQGGRCENQDDIGWTETPLGFILVVCDGMGGGPGGKTASGLAKQVFLTEMVNSNQQAVPNEALKRAVSMANDALYQRMEEQPSLQGMGSTLVAVLVNEQAAWVVHLGDSRCYQVRKGRVVFRTNDHSLVGELVQKKALSEEQARLSPQSNVIMRGLGNTSNHAPEIEKVSYKPGDRFVLCTDGVWGMMPQKQLTNRLTSLQDIVSLANNLSAEIDQIGFGQGGKHDNHTLAIIEMMANSKNKGKTLTNPKAFIGLLSALLVASLVLNIYSLASRSNDLYESMLKEKQEEIQRLQAYQKLYNEVKDAGSNELVKRVEILEYEKESLQEFIDSMLNRIDSLESSLQAIQSHSKDKSATKKEDNATAQVTAQKIINRFEEMKKISGKDFGKTLGKKAECRNRILSLLNELNQKTSKKYSPRIEAVARELKYQRSEALLVEQNNNTYVSTQTAKKKIDQLIRKISEIKEKM